MYIWLDWNQNQKKYILLTVRGGMKQGEGIGEVVGLLYYSFHFVDL